MMIVVDRFSNVMSGVEVSIDLGSSSSKQGLVGRGRNYESHGSNSSPFSPEDRVQSSSSDKILRIIFSDRDCRRLFYFLTLMSTITLIQVLYGTHVGSLGLISAAFHSVFDCLSLVISLTAMVFTKHRPTGKFSYGYDRFEILSSFSNGVFLLFVSLFLLFESIERLGEPEEFHGIESGPIVFVAFLGLLVNIIGVSFFYDARVRRQETQRQPARSENVYTILVHITLDAVANLGVILSTWLISHGWLLADPLVAIGIIALIGYNALPICARTAKILLQTTPPALKDALERSLREASTIEGVLECRNEHFWTQSHNIHVGSVIVRVGSGVNEQEILQKVHALFDPLVSDFTAEKNQLSSESGVQRSYISYSNPSAPGSRSYTSKPTTSSYSSTINSSESFFFYTCNGSTSTSPFINWAISRSDKSALRGASS
ncbi:hypothetical protein PROFUN_15089 [Planoprotostelium fungivorum]|uniref:Cation efflux protein transmembrane domain-containing protein n=1 Tax=Planoprotostelium fungivorum TaxID=1890364 RepID=A0A2P6MXT0_9EUKA|nr:hypothetical protein PROFUN_15089 [Planoprotostelium fungivorum]